MSEQQRREQTGYRIAPVQEQLLQEWNREARFAGGTDQMEQREQPLHSDSSELFGSARTELELEVEGNIPTDALAKSLERIIATYEILRSTYPSRPGRRFPIQVVLDALPPIIIEESEAENLPTDRLLLYRHVDADRTYLRLSAPTFICDGRTLVLIAEELLNGLSSDRGEQSGQSDQDEPDVLQYAQYAEWSRQFVEEPEEEGVEWWKSLQGEDPLGQRLAAERPERSFNADHILLPAELSRHLQVIAERLDRSVGQTARALWGAFLTRILPTERLYMVCDMDGRDFEELLDVVGPVARSVPVRLMSAEGTSDSWLKQIAESIASANEASDYYPFDESPFGPDSTIGSRSRKGIEGAVEVHRNGSLRRADNSTNASATIRSLRSIRLPFVVKLSILLPEEEGRNGTAELLYDASRLSRLTATTIGDMFCRFAAEGAEASGMELATSPLLDDASIRSLNELWNQESESLSVPADSRDILVRIEEMFQSGPALPAIVDGDREYSRSDLNVRASAIARRLLAEGVGPGDIVPLHLHRSFDALASIIAVLKTGAAFLPIDPSLPTERKLFMIEESNAGSVITTEALQAGLVGLGTSILLLESVEATDLEVEGDRVDSDQPAYVIFTSGSTGRPKGCVIRRRNISSYINWASAYYPAASGLEDRPAVWPLFTSLSFDLTLTSILVPLVSGGVLRLYDNARSTQDVIESIFHPESDISLVKMTPAQVSLLATIPLTSTGVRGVILGGEQLRSDHVELLRKLDQSIALFNEYGPTETTVGCTVEQIGLDGEEITIGRPLPGTSVLVLDEEGELVAPYQTGELWVGGAGVGAGYLGRPEVTAERFRSDLAVGGGATLYRTGDLVWRHPDGRLVYVGRNDEQVKVRGYRIELGEIRAALASLPGVDDALVLPHGSDAGEIDLAAWVVSRDRWDEASVRVELARRLPDYMIPRYLMQVEEIPLTSNGKPDRERLPSPAATQQQYVPPSNVTEERIAEIWQTILGVERVGTTDNFFELGGHSLLAMRMIAQVNLAFERDLKIQTLFDAPTVAGLASHLDDLTESDYQPIVRSDETSDFELSDAQRRLWVLEQMEDLGAAYHIFGAYDINGSFRPDLFNLAWNRLIERHEILRTTIRVQEGRPMQHVNRAMTIEIPLFDLRNVAEAELEAREIARTVLQQPFDLEQDLPIRAAIVMLGDEGYRLLLSMHHIAGDGWSVGIIVRELVELYAALEEGRDPNLPSLPIQFRDVVRYRSELLASPEGERLRSYWHEQLQGAAPLDLPVDRPRKSNRSYRGAATSFRLRPEETAILQRIVSSSDASLFMILVGLVDVLLHRYTGERDITIGTAVAGRDRAEFEHQVGFFINTLPLRVDVSGEKSFSQLLQEIRTVAVGAFDHQAYPFDRLIDELGLEREGGRSPLFETLVVLQNQEQPALRFGSTELTPHPIENDANVYDLAFSFEEGEGGLEGILSYNASIFDRERIDQLLGNLRSLITSLSQPHGLTRPIAELDLAGGVSLKGQIAAWESDPSFPEMGGKGIVGLFEEAAATYPDQIAIESNDRSMTFNEVRRRTNGIALHLLDRLQQASALHPAQQKVSLPRIAVLLPRSVEIPLLMIALRKARVVYVPIDIDYPLDRIERMFDESRVDLVITNGEGERLLADRGDNRRDLDIVTVEDLGPLEADSLPDLTRDPGDIVAIIFTSGSTGLPKGVNIDERGLENSTRAKIACSANAEFTSIRYLQFASPSFDASIITALVPLLSGGTCCVVDRTTIEDREAFLRFMADRRVTDVILPPSYLASLGRPDFPGLRMLMTAGEPPVIDDARYYADRLTYINAYGPSEASIYVSSFVVSPEEEYPLGIPIGREIGGDRLLILDPHGMPVPAGCDGELYVGGIGCGPGYLADEETAERFVELPGLPGERFYRTGDIVRRQFDGNLLFRGRRDNQVKIRGHRVEPEEIATRIASKPGISDATVIAWRDAGDRLVLVAWVVPEKGTDDADIPQLRTDLAEHLPGYMIPSHFFTIEELPLTPNDKVDLQVLRNLTTGRIDQIDDESSGREAATPEERVITRAVAAILGRGSVSPDDNYFMLGGDSIRAIQVTWRLQEEGYQLEVRDLFAHPLLSDAALKLRPVDNRSTVEERTGEIPLHPIQHWFFEQATPESRNHFNQSVLLRWKDGSLDPERLQVCLNTLAEVHPMLRTRFEEIDGRFRQVVHEEGAVPLDEVSLELDRSGDLFSEELRRTHESLHIVDGPLCRAKLIHGNEGGESHDYLQIVAHHLIVDILSWHLLLEDLPGLYNGTVERDDLLRRKTAPYSSWVEEMRELVQGREGKRYADFWNRQAEEAGEPVLITVDRSHPNSAGAAEEMTFGLTAEITGRLQQGIHDIYRTDVRDILVAALGAAARGVSRGERGVIAMEGHGRRIDAVRNDVSRTVGWFTGLYPVLLQDRTGDGQQFPDYSWIVRQAKEALRSAPLEGNSYGMLRYLDHEHGPIADLLATHAQITLNYLGVEGGASGNDVTSSFEIVPEPSDILQSSAFERPTELEIVAAIRDGSLQGSISFVPGRIERGVVERLAAEWMEQIAHIVEHLEREADAALTPSDIDYDGLSIDDLDSILAGISGGGEKTT